MKVLYKNVLFTVSVESEIITVDVACGGGALPETRQMGLIMEWAKGCISWAREGEGEGGGEEGSLILTTRHRDLFSFTSLSRSRYSMISQGRRASFLSCLFARLEQGVGEKEGREEEECNRSRGQGQAEEGKRTSLV